MIDGARAIQEIDDEQLVDVLDLSGQTNESAGLEVAVECLRCARLIGLVISSGDFETALDCARSLNMPEVCNPLCKRSTCKPARISHSSGMRWCVASVVDHDICGFMQSPRCDS